MAKHHHNRHNNKHNKIHKNQNKKAIPQQNKTFEQKVKDAIRAIINFFKNLFSKKPIKKEEKKNLPIVIKDENFLNKVENMIIANQSVSELTTPLYSAYISDPDVARISKLVNGQIPVNEANLDFQNLLASEDVVEHLLKSNKVSPKIKDKVQEIKDKMDKKKQKLQAQPGFKSKPSEKPKPRI